MLDVAAQPDPDDFLALLKSASDGGAILEARAEGSSEVAGVATRAYTFVIDLAALTGDWPPFLEGFLGDAAGAPPAAEAQSFLPSPLPANFTLQVGTDGFVRQMGLALDLGAILTAVFAGFGELAETPDGAGPEMPEIEYLFAVRFETPRRQRSVPERDAAGPVAGCRPALTVGTGARRGAAPRSTVRVLSGNLAAHIPTTA